MYEALAYILCLLIIGVVLGIAIAPNLISNSPSRSKRAKEMQDFAVSFGLNYISEESRTLWQKFFSYTRKTNIISGNYNGKEISIYDYKTVTSYDISIPFLGGSSNDTKRYTYVNGSYLKSNLSVENIKNVLDGTLDEQEVVYKNEKWKLNIGMFVIFIILIIAINIVFFGSLQETIGKLSSILVHIFVSLILLYIAHVISKKSYSGTPIR
ncbi:MAG TPA: hypothetical protein VJH63_02180 [Candidatus Paceibacterota bacterium]